jgi:hypothetical protein
LRLHTDASERICDLTVHRCNRLEHPLAAVSLLVAVASFNRLMRASACTRGDRGATERTALKMRFNLNGGIAAGVKDFARV